MARIRRKRDWRKYRKPIMYIWKEGLNYVAERLIDPMYCQPGQYSTISSKTIPALAAKGVKIRICCPIGTYMHVVHGKRIGCYDDGRRIRTPIAQSVIHEVNKFKMRHPDIWKKLMRQPKDEFGYRRLIVRPEALPEALRVAGFGNVF